MKSMHSPEELKNQSRNLLEDLGRSLSEMFSPVPNDGTFDELLARLDAIPFSRTYNIELSSTTISTLLQKS